MSAAPAIVIVTMSPPEGCRPTHNLLFPGVSLAQDPAPCVPSAPGRNSEPSRGVRGARVPATGRGMVRVDEPLSPGRRLAGCRASPLPKARSQSSREKPSGARHLPHPLPAPPRPASPPPRRLTASDQHTTLLGALARMSAASYPGTRPPSASRGAGVWLPICGHTRPSSLEQESP